MIEKGDDVGGQPGALISLWRVGLFTLPMTPLIQGDAADPAALEGGVPTRPAPPLVAVRREAVNQDDGPVGAPGGLMSSKASVTPWDRKVDMGFNGSVRKQSYYKLPSSGAALRRGGV